MQFFELIIGVYLLIILLVIITIFHNRLTTRRIAAVLGHEKPLLVMGRWEVGRTARYRLLRLGDPFPRWQRRMLLITPSRFMIYDVSGLRQIFLFTPEELQWVGLPDKYDRGFNEILLHIEKDHGWYVLQMHGSNYDNRGLLLALSRLALPGQIGAYRRRRGDIHYGPVAAQPATQDIHGAWILEAPVTLYLMPRYVIILDRQTVLRKIPLEAVQQIGALRRLDAPGAQGLVRFRAEEETFAFAVDEHEAFAAALAEAAKRTLEAPLERKQKSQDEDDSDMEDWEADFEMPHKRLRLR